MERTRLVRYIRDNRLLPENIKFSSQMRNTPVFLGRFYYFSL